MPKLRALFITGKTCIETSTIEIEVRHVKVNKDIEQSNSGHPSLYGKKLWLLFQEHR